MNLPDSVILLDSLGDLKPHNTSPILVCGSHCGGNRELAFQVKSCGVEAVFLNNAGIGKNQAGIKGLGHYGAENILACAIDCHSAEIGVASDTWENGIISHINTLSEAAGIEIGDSVKVAVSKILNLNRLTSTHRRDHYAGYSADKNVDGNNDLKKQFQTSIGNIKVIVTNSITFLNQHNAGDIVVCGSHGGNSAGHYAMGYGVQAVFFNDAGIGKNQAGIQSLNFLSEAGILACTVDCMSAEIFNGHDVLENGIISASNQLAMSKNIKAGMSVMQALHCLK